MDVSTLIIFTVVVVLISTWLSKRKSVKNPLPGPNGLPLVGYMPFMTSKPYEKLTALKKKYGPVFKVRLGSVDVVILASFEAIKEAFADDAFMGRPRNLPFDLDKETIRTGAFLDLPWKEQRRFSLHTLRDLGFGKTQMEGHIKEEIFELTSKMSEYASAKKPIVMAQYLAPSMSNNVASLLFGKRLKYDDPKRVKLNQLFSDIGRLAGAATFQTFFPWIEKFMRFFQIGPTGKLNLAIKEVKDYIREEIVIHEESFNENNIRDFMDGYLHEVYKQTSNPDSPFKKEVLLDLARAFFGAGTETVRSTVDWMLLVCATNQQLQQKIHKEIDQVLGEDRFPTWQDRFNMPYTEAAICEVMRWKSIIPLNVMRSTLKDTELNGYFIPKDSPVLGILWAVDHDETLWGKDAFELKPERFLSEDGQKVIKPEYFIPFSIGKRSCPGKSLAEIEVFLYIVALLQKFETSIPPGKTADLEGILGIGLMPKRQQLSLRMRHS